MHSSSCAGFASHRDALRRSSSFSCRLCTIPSAPLLPLISTPAVADRVVVPANLDDTLPAAVNDVSIASSTAPSTAPLTSSPRAGVHSSPDHGRLTLRTAPPPPPSVLSPSFSLDDVFSARIPVLRHCPKTARRELASLKNALWSDVLMDPTDTLKWTKAFAYTKLVLFLPPGKKNFKEKAATVKARISSFREGRLDTLWHQATRLPPRRTSPSSSSSSNVHRATLLAQEGQFSKAAKALISKGLDFDSPDVLRNMSTLHPSSLPPPPLPAPSASPYSFSSSEVLNALLSFHSLSAGGPTACRAAHFREAISSDRGNSLLSTMTRLINFLAAGKAPPTIAAYLCGGNLFAALKKNGGHRPIAVGETIRRWTAKCVAKKATADTSSYLAPLQLGVGVRGGAEAIIHAANSLFHDNAIPGEDKWTLQVDFTNAFNTINREAMLMEVRRHCPKATAWADYCYASHSHLFFGDSRISSETGAHQGDPLASLFFALVLHPILLQLKDLLPNLLLNCSFLDDVTIIGNQASLQTAYDFLRDEGARVGLSLNPQKSLIHAPSLDSTILDPLGRGVPRAADGGFQLLGAPVGNIPFSRDVVSSRIEKISAILDVLYTLNNAQLEYSLLRHCFSFPKMAYCLRTCDPQSLLPIYSHFDYLQRLSLVRIVGRPLSDAARDQAFLPIKLGGAGLFSTSQISAAAYIASIKTTRSVIQSILPPASSPRLPDSAFLHLQQETGNPAYSSMALLPPSSTQHSLTEEIHSHHHSVLLSSSSLRDRARLRSLALPHAGDWLDALPSPSLNLQLDSRSFGAALGYRLGIPLLSAGDCRAPTCSSPQDEFGDHALHCRDDHGLKGGRHDRIRDVIFRVAQHASLNPRKEMPGLIPNSLSRPADVFVENWVDGRKVAFDVSVTSPTQEATVLQAANRPGAAIDARKASKNRAHFADCRAQGIFFQPLVVESFGGWDRDALLFLKELGRQDARRWGKDPAQEIRYFFQRLSVALQRGNAALLVDRDPEPSSQ